MKTLVAFERKKPPITNSESKSKHKFKNNLKFTRNLPRGQLDG